MVERSTTSRPSSHAWSDPVRGVIAASNPPVSMSKVRGSMSTKTGNAPSRVTQPAVAKKLKAGTTTSSPGPTSRAMSATRMASVPEETPIPWAASQ